MSLVSRRISDFLNIIPKEAPIMWIPVVMQNLPEISMSLVLSEEIALSMLVKISWNRLCSLAMIDLSFLG